MKTAMIFAAGRGERLKPLTDTCPKALCQVHGMPLIEHHIKHLVAAGIQTIIVNIAHLGGTIRDYLGDGSRWHTRIVYSTEPPGALETGGGLVNARHLLGNAPFITVNADIFTDYDFSLLALPKAHLGHLVLINRPSYYAHGDFGVTPEGYLSLSDKHYTFSGIACYSPELFDYLKPGRFSITPFIKSHIKHQRISAEIYNGNWIDIGSPERLAQANKDQGQPIKTIIQL